MADRLADGRQFRILTLVDNSSRVSPALEADFSLTGERVVVVLDRLKATCGLPETISVDTGPEFISRALDAWAHHNGVKLEFSRPGRPTDRLAELAELLRARNTLDAQIAAIIGRPPEKGHLGEYIAARIFGIQLQESASHKGIDGYFASGPLAGRSVNVKYYGKRDGLLAVAPADGPDYYLVLTGAKAGAGSSKGMVRPFVISSVYLFAHGPLHAAITAKPDRFATSVRAHLWEAAEVFPTPSNSLLSLSDKQRELLALFSIE